MKVRKIFLECYGILSAILLGATLAAGIEYGFYGEVWIGIALGIVNIACSKLAVWHFSKVDESEEAI